MKVVSQVRPDKDIRRILSKRGPGIARTREILRNAVVTALSLKSGGTRGSAAIPSSPAGSSDSAGVLTGTITVTLVDDEEISGLNSEYFGENGPTDVIAFPYFEPPPERPEGADYEPAFVPAEGLFRGEEEPFGDVVISVETALSQAREYGVSLERELVLLAVHGALHLLGYDDKTAGDRALMRKAEEEVLRHLGYS